MLSDASPTELVRRPRRSAPKVRTGCLTCKIRRVKCDESKPSCLRCASTGRKCDGYAPNKKEVRSQVFAVSPVATPQRNVPLLSGYGENIQYLEFYHHCAGPILSTKFDKEFWSRISLQFAQSEAAVRHALIALGYLHKTEPGSLKHARSGFLAYHEHKTLLFHYNKAVSCLIQRISEPSYSPEIGLVSCVLFICIEFLRGNYVTAFDHLDSGLRIINELKKSRRDDETASAALSRSTGMMEETLIPIFIRMMSTALLYGISAEEKIDSSYYPVEIQKRPFNNMLEAQTSMHSLRVVAIVFIRDLAVKHVNGIKVKAEDVQHQAHILECHRAWLGALEGLERKKALSPEDRIISSVLKAGYWGTYIYAACSVDINEMAYDQYLDGFKALVYNARIVLDSMNLSATSSSSSSPSTAYSTSSTSSSDSASVTPSPKSSPAAHFTFEISIIPPLYFAATCCRCPTTRREAVALLERNPPREGLWDAEQHVVVSKRVIEIEESELDPVTGWPVERIRMWSSVINGDMDGNGRFKVFFTNRSWFEDKPLQLPPGRSLARNIEGMMWAEWFVL